MEKVKLGDICIFIRNGANIKNDASKKGTPITRIETIANGKIDEMRMGYADIFDNKYEDYYLKKNDILMSHINSMKHLGKVAICDEDKKVIHGMNLLNIRLKSEFNVKYLYYFFKSNNFKKQLNKISKQSVNQSSFSVNDLKKIQIGIPEESEQTRISIKLEKVQEIIDIKEKQIEELNQLIKSHFVEMFGNDNCEGKGWQDVFNTTTGKLDSNAMVKDGIYPFFTCAKEVFAINEYAFDCEALLLAGNNAAGVYDVKHYKGKFNAYQRTYVLTLKDEKWRYELFKLQLEEKLELLKHQSKGSNTRYLTMKILNDLTFKVPNLNLQNQFAEFVKLIDKQKFEIQKSLEEVQKLQESLMNKYFGG